MSHFTELYEATLAAGPENTRAALLRVVRGIVETNPAAREILRNLVNLHPNGCACIGCAILTKTTPQPPPRG